MTPLYNITVRFFILDQLAQEEGEDDTLLEVSEDKFLAAEGWIDYMRHTVFDNGVTQICLTKSPNNDPLR